MVNYANVFKQDTPLFLMKLRFLDHDEASWLELVRRNATLNRHNWIRWRSQEGPETVPFERSIDEVLALYEFMENGDWNPMLDFMTEGMDRKSIAYHVRRLVWMVGHDFEQPSEVIPPLVSIYSRLSEERATQTVLEEVFSLRERTCEDITLDNLAPIIRGIAWSLGSVLGMYPAALHLLDSVPKDSMTSILYLERALTRAQVYQHNANYPDQGEENQRRLSRIHEDQEFALFHPDPAPRLYHELARIGIERLVNHFSPADIERWEEEIRELIHEEVEDFRERVKTGGTETYLPGLIYYLLNIFIDACDHLMKEHVPKDDPLFAAYWVRSKDYFEDFIHVMQQIPLDWSRRLVRPLHEGIFQLWYELPAIHHLTRELIFKVTDEEEIVTHELVSFQLQQEGTSTNCYGGYANRFGQNVLISQMGPCTLEAAVQHPIYPHSGRFYNLVHAAFNFGMVAGKINVREDQDGTWLLDEQGEPAVRVRSFTVIDEVIRKTIGKGEGERVARSCNEGDGFETVDGSRVYFPKQNKFLDDFIFSMSEYLDEGEQVIREEYGQAVYEQALKLSHGLVHTNPKLANFTNNGIIFDFSHLAMGDPLFFLGVLCADPAVGNMLDERYFEAQVIDAAMAPLVPEDMQGDKRALRYLFEARYYLLKPLQCVSSALAYASRMEYRRAWHFTKTAMDALMEGVESAQILAESFARLLFSTHHYEVQECLLQMFPQLEPYACEVYDCQQRNGQLTEIPASAQCPFPFPEQLREKIGFVPAPPWMR